MNDLNDDLIEMFRRREGDVRTPASAPTNLVARTRRRERLTVGLGMMAVVIVVVVSIAGLRSLGSSDGSQPGDIGPTTTKTVSGITITYPERWFAEDPVAIGIEPNDTPRTLPTLVLTLTRDDPHNQGVLGCPLMAEVPPGQLLMTVQETPLASSGEGSAAWPVPLRTWAGFDSDLGCYAGWSGMRASWTAAGRSFEARLGFSPDASDDDRAALLDAFASMSFAPGSVSTQDGSGPATGDAGSGDVIATGTDVVGGPWALTITHQPKGDGIAFEWVEYVNASGTGCCLHNTKIGDHDLVFDSMGWTAGAPTVILAFASTRTARVGSEIDGVTYEAKLYPLPARYLGPLQIAVLFLPDDVAPKEPEDIRALRLVAYDAQGAVLEREAV
jgi:hypothetical protein